MLTKFKKVTQLSLLLSLTVSSALSLNTGSVVNAAKAESSGSYRTVTEIEDWGAAVTKVIVDLKKNVPVNSVNKNTFNVFVSRSDSRLSNPFLEKGYRTVTKAYVSDKNGNPVTKSGRYAVIEMQIGPALSLSFGLNYDLASGYNAWSTNKYTITQQKDIVTTSGKKVSGMVFDQYSGRIRELVDEFDTGQQRFNGVNLTYADYTPAKDKGKNPLIIWLHGAGEGGVDPTIPISGNKAANFASQEIQSYFGGAYVLAPQTPTFWMDGFTGFGDGTSKYEKALMTLIKDYVAQNSDIDPNRIYLGGDSNGGYMTMLLIRDNPDYFAAAFTAAEALKDELITDSDIEKIKQTPLWLVAAKNDPIVPVDQYSVPTYNRLVTAGAEDVHLSLFDKVVDTSGLYKNADGSAFEYNGHWSWIYVYNNEVSDQYNGKTITLMDWLKQQTLK